jgi:hypothetical protein
MWAEALALAGLDSKTVLFQWLVHDQGGGLLYFAILH